MKDLKTIHDILLYKKNGFNKSETARYLEINRNTVRKYWNIENEKEYKKLLYEKSRMFRLLRHEDIIKDSLRKNPFISAKKITKLLYSLYGETYSERTVSNFIQELRSKYYLQKYRFR